MSAKNLGQRKKLVIRARRPTSPMICQNLRLLMLGDIFAGTILTPPMAPSIGDRGA